MGKTRALEVMNRYSPEGGLASSGEILARQAQRESNARSYARRLALVLRSAQGAYVTDVNGRQYIDCLAGAGTLALGHNHPEVIEALQATLASGLPLHTLDLSTPVKDEFVDELFSSLPAPMRNDPLGWKIQFCSPSGADGVEAAIKLAKTATGRSSVVAFHGAYHGMTQGALSITGNLGAKEQVHGLMPYTHFLPYPYPYRCPFGLGDRDGAVASRYFERVLKDPESGISKPAAVILEAVQGEGGVIPAPAPWLRSVRRVTRELGIPLILDEVQAGIGRTGSLFAFEQADIVPDAVVISKAVGGSLPLAVVVYRADLDTWQSGAHAGTFRGHQLGMVAGLVTLKKVRQPAFLERVQSLGKRLGNALLEARGRLQVMGDVRQAGLMLGVEIVDPRKDPDELGSFPAWPELARRIQQQALELGLIIELGGRHGCVIRLLPPLDIDESIADSIAQRLIAAVESAWDQAEGRDS